MNQLFLVRALLLVLAGSVACGQVAWGQFVRLEYRCVVESTPDDKTTATFTAMCPQEVLLSPDAALTRMEKSAVLIQRVKGKPNRTIELDEEAKTWKELKDNLAELTAMLEDQSAKAAMKDAFVLTIGEIEDLPPRNIAGIKAKGNGLEIRAAFNLAAPSLKENPELAQSLRSLEPLSMRWESYIAEDLQHPFADGHLEQEQMLLSMEIMLRQFGADSAAVQRLRQLNAGLALSTMMEMKLGLLGALGGAQGADRPLRFRMEAVRVSTAPIEASEFAIPADFFRIQ